MIVLLASATPVPAVATATAPTIQGWLIPVLVAMIGVIGVSVGAWLASGSALRIRLMDMTQRQADAQRDFQVSAVRAVNDLGIAMALAILRQTSNVRTALTEAVEQATVLGITEGTVTVTGQVPLDPALDEQVKVSTEAWRAVLAEAHAFADGTMIGAFEEFDAQRANVVDTFNGARTLDDFERASAECEVLRSVYGPQVYRVLQVEKAKGAWRMYQLAHTRRIRTLARRISVGIEHQVNGGIELVEGSRQAVAQHRKSLTSDPEPA